MLAFGVQQAPRTLGLGGMPRTSGGVYRRLDGQVPILSGKPTFLSAHLRDA